MEDNDGDRDRDGDTNIDRDGDRSYYNDDDNEETDIIPKPKGDDIKGDDIKGDETKIINALLHLVFMNDVVSQINKYKLDVLKDIYTTYFTTSNLTYNEFKQSIFKNKRPYFIKKENNEKGMKI
jgi:hypothetical protein